MKVSKKIVVVLLLLAMTAAALASCMPNTTSTGTKYELALVGGITDINEKSVNGSIWSAIRSYGNEVSLKYKYYTPSYELPAAYDYAVEKGDEAVQGNAVSLLTREGKVVSVRQQVDLAAAAGAQVIVLTGPYAVESYTYSKDNMKSAKDYYTDPYFIFADVEKPEDGVLNDKSAAIVYDNTAYGYLYAAVAAKLGYTKIGYVGYEDATSERIIAGMQKVEGVTVTHTYITSDKEAKDAADGLYDDGAEIILAENYTLTKSVIESAERKSTKVMGVGADTTTLSDRVVFSLEKNITEAVGEMIRKAKNGSFVSGVHEYAAESFVLCRGEGADALTDEDYGALQEEAASKELPAETAE